MMEIDAGEGEEVDGSSGVAGGALQSQLDLTPAPAAPGGCSDEIPAGSSKIGQRDGAGTIRGRRRGEWCAEMGEGRPPYIVSTSGRSGVTGAMVMTVLQAARVLGEGMAGFRVSWRASRAS